MLSHCMARCVQSSCVLLTVHNTQDAHVHPRLDCVPCRAISRKFYQQPMKRGAAADYSSAEVDRCIQSVGPPLGNIGWLIPSALANLSSRSLLSTLCFIFRRRQRQPGCSPVQRRLQAAGRVGEHQRRPREEHGRDHGVCAQGGDRGGEGGGGHQDLKRRAHQPL